jgi:hypothetical protein
MTTNSTFVKSATKEELLPLCDPDEGILAQLHHHPNDDRILFNDVNHVYFCQWVESDPLFYRSIQSVSSFAHEYFPKFDADAVIKKMMRSATWESSKYYGMEPSQIKNMWSNEGKKASEKGTTYHKYIEDYYNGLLFTEEQESIKEIQQFMDWNEKCKERGWEVYRTEWRLFSDEKYKLAGTADLLLVDPVQDDPDTLRLILADHKFSKEIKMSNKYQKGKGPCKEMDDVNYNHYSIAMNAYKWMLESFYHDVFYKGKFYPKVRITAMYLDVYHETYNAYKEYPINDVSHVLQPMLEFRQKNMATL